MLLDRRRSWKQSYLGKRIDVSSTPKVFKQSFNHIARVFKNACEKDTKEAWDEFAKV